MLEKPNFTPGVDFLPEIPDVYISPSHPGVEDEPNVAESARGSSQGDADANGQEFY